MTYSLEELAKMFRVSPRTMTDKLRAMPGFPRRLPGSRVWSKPAVDAWISGKSGDLEACSAELDRGL